MRTSCSSRHSGHTSSSTRGRGNGSSCTHRHNLPPPASSSALVPVLDIAPPKYRAWDSEIQDVAVFFVHGLRRQDILTCDKEYGRMVFGGWQALTYLMNELIAINNHQYKPLTVKLLSSRIQSSYEQGALEQFNMSSDLPRIPSRNWIGKEFLDIVLSYPTPVPTSLIMAARISASTTPDMCWLWGGLELRGIKEAALAIRQHNDYKNGITSSPPLPAERFLKRPSFVPEHQSSSSSETYDGVRAQEPGHRPAVQQEVGQSSSDYQDNPSVSQALAHQPCGTQQAGAFPVGYSQDYASEQQPAYPGQPTQYQGNQGSSSNNQSWAIQSSTGQISATQSYVSQPSGRYTGVHSRGYQNGQSGHGSQDDQCYYDQGSGR
ncbi:uncharacterized protein EAF01_003695 [Botrytis porri]|uniref:uncharacterized protein n=1 Tax=Botrytis porri TaxID=87229 RepID=UPI00190069CD|nr:uncharacterized protein EAF01_003695 [Botrytis porri]KAF7909977.1 hypothetical protein EAF01_003695 [Botrytis porri]